MRSSQDLIILTCWIRLLSDVMASLKQELLHHILFQFFIARENLEIKCKSSSSEESVIIQLIMNRKNLKYVTSNHGTLGKRYSDFTRKLINFINISNKTVF